MIRVQHESGSVLVKASRSVEQMCSDGFGQALSYSSTDDVSSIVVRVLQPKKARFVHDCGSHSTHAEHDAQRSRIGVRRTMRKEAELECDAIARSFDAVLDTVLRGVEQFVGTNMSSFATNFAHTHRRSSTCVSERLTNRFQRSLQLCRTLSLRWRRSNRRFARHFWCVDFYALLTELLSCR